MNLLNKVESTERLKEVLETQATSYDYEETLSFIYDKVQEYGGVFEMDEHDNAYVTKGVLDESDEAYPCVVCHTDTVHDIYKGYKVIDVGEDFIAFDTWTMKQVGTGGDDKVGIWIALEMLRKYDKIKVGFFAQEEIGCIGSSRADADWLSDVGYIFECDRKGALDFVNESSGVTMFGKEFEGFISPTLKKYDRKITTGGLTDVHELSKIANVACANMSCGYYNPHSSTEFVNKKDAMNTMLLVDELIEVLGNTKHYHKAEDNWSYGYYHNYGAYGYRAKPIKTIPNTTKDFTSCDMCGALSTQGCDFCHEAKSEDAKVFDNSRKDEKCGCGGDLKLYAQGSYKYQHCYDCGYYLEGV